MNRYEFTNNVRSILGIKSFTALQSRLKFFLNFRHDYNRKFPSLLSQKNKSLYVFMVDGKTLHGGLSDRLRGLLSTYYYAKETGKDFKICWSHPFELSDYLVAKKHDLYITKEDMCFNSKDVDFKYFNSYCDLDDREALFFDIMQSDRKQVHVYSNVTQREDLFSQLFDELFTLDSRLQKSIDKALHVTEGNSYVSITFRFIGLLGDFVDHAGFGGDISAEEQEEYIQKAIRAIEQLHRKHRDQMILVTSNSNIFQDRVKSIPYVFIADGKIAHMDHSPKSNYEVYLKNFVDMFLIARASASYSYSTGLMFKATRFAKTAALLGNHSIQMIEE